MSVRCHTNLALRQTRGVLAAMMLGLFPHVAAEAETEVVMAEPLRVGLLPFLTPSVLVKKFQPVVSHLEHELRRPVVVSSAPNFATYIERIEQGEYDLFLTAPHISAYLEETHQARRIAGFNRPLKGYFVVHKDSKIRAIGDLRQKQIAMPDPLAIISMLGELSLRDDGIDSRRDVSVLRTTHNNALLLVASGRQDAAVVGISSFENAPLAVRSKLRILSQTRRVPHMMFQSRAGLDEQEYTKLRMAMLKFTAQGAGKDFFRHSAFGDMTQISDEQMLRLSGLAALLKSQLE